MVLVVVELWLEHEKLQYQVLGVVVVVVVVVVGRVQIEDLELF